MGRRSRRRNKVRSNPVNVVTDFKRDEQRFNNAMKSGQMIDIDTFKKLFSRSLLTNTKILETGCIGDIRLEDIEEALKTPHANWRIILHASEILMRVSPYYYRMNMFFANMATFYWGIDLYGVDNSANVSDIKDRFNKLSLKLEDMNLSHEFQKIMRVLPYQDLYCGLLVESPNGCYIQQINLNVCRLYRVDDGLFNFKINLDAIVPSKLESYPDYVQQEWLNHKENIHEYPSCWYEPPADKQICIKLNTQWNYPMPLMVNLVKDILNLDVYKKLALQSARTDNYKAIIQKIPIDEDAVDKPLLTTDVLSVFAEMNYENMTDDIGMLYTLGSDGEAISFKNSNNTRNNVADAVQNIYDGSGVSKEMFNGSSSATAVNYSVENDSAFVYNIYRQFERWVNRYIKRRRFNRKLFKFSFYLLDVTVFNKDSVSKRYLDACTLGATVVDKWMASLGITPSKVLGSYVLHKDIFDFQNNFVPLQSTYNSNGTSNEGGRPTNESNGELLGDAGEITLDADSNNDR